jgi:hypothetical protein
MSTSSRPLRPPSSSALLDLSAPHPALHPACTVLSFKSSIRTNIATTVLSFNEPDKVVATTAKMVQSAILGFPRMGVNRDLKKATEACQSPTHFH